MHIIELAHEKKKGYIGLIKQNKKFRKKLYMTRIYRSFIALPITK
jgi:hypothetical protein